MKLPTEVNRILGTLQEAGFEAFAVGGCVRDLLLERKPKDWDVTTNARPEDIQKLFPRNFYNNEFGTVTVLMGKRLDKTSPPPPLLEKERGAIREVEVTTYRADGRYSDKRHPDEVKFASRLKDDLARRDFTVNAMAMTESNEKQEASKEDTITIDGLMIVDPLGGMKDLDAKLIRAVGNPEERFKEDALRLFRAIRFAAQLGFSIDGSFTPSNSPSERRGITTDEENREATTYEAIIKLAETVKVVSPERIRDELNKIVMSARAEYGFNLLRDLGLLKIVLPEVSEGIGVDQNKHHVFTVYEHSVKSLQYAAKYDYGLAIRWAALLHDVGKPRTRRRKGNDYTFYGHDVVGARMAEKAMKRLKFSNEITQKVKHLIRHHMFYYDVGKVTEAGARRLLRRVGRENFDDLIKLRIAERKGSGVPKAEPYRLRHLQFLVEKAAKEPITTGQLVIGGKEIMEKLGLRPGPRIGGILNALLAEVLDDPGKNNEEYLLAKAEELKDKDVGELKAMGETAKDEVERKREDDIRRKYRV